jgi:hypothetical protein|eukprot:COSAG01_NODE_7971_length_2969_cov_7.580139_2_plen_89_part_00
MFAAETTNAARTWTRVLHLVFIVGVVASAVVKIRHRLPLRVRVELMGSQKCRIVGKSQSVLTMSNPIISTRTRMRPEASERARLFQWI